MSIEASRLMDLDEMGKGMSQTQILGGLKQKQVELKGLIGRIQSYHARNIERDRKRGFEVE